MARYTKDQFLSHLAAYTAGSAIGAKNTAKFFAYAGKKGINLAGLGARRAAVPAARGLGALIRRHPVAFAGLTLYEAEQMGLLDEPRERALDLTGEALGRAGRYLPNRTPQQMIEDLQMSAAAEPTPKKKKSTPYNRAVKLGMAKIKATTSNGKKGTISKPQAAFKTVNQVASRMFAKKKVPKTGIKGQIARAIRKDMPKSTWTVKVRKS
jgi:hypothetical protein